VSIVDLYSRRKRLLEKGGEADVYQYKDVPRSLRVQIIYIWREAIGQCFQPNPYGMGHRPPNSNDWWKEIHSKLAREKGLFALGPGETPLDQCANYLLSATHIEDILDTVELTFGVIHNLGLDERRWQREANHRNLKQRPDAAITELNFRFREAGVGYQLENGQIIRVDSQYIHAEALKSVLVLLSDPRFSGPQEEFLHAHELYRTAKPNDHKKLEDAVAGALKAFESTLKVICDLSKWPYPANITAVPLIKLVIEKGLIPSFLQSSLEGLATLRNKIGAHGQGAEVRSVPFTIGRICTPFGGREHRHAGGCV
jgi:hypothetical protein